MPRDVDDETCGAACPDHGSPCPVCTGVLEDRREFDGAEAARSLEAHRQHGLHLCLHPARNGEGEPHTWRGAA